MIVRIMGGGQFKVADSLMTELNRIDNQIVEHVKDGRETDFRRDLQLLISTVIKKGEPLVDTDLMGSDVIIPPGDLSIAEAKRFFHGQGLIEG